MTLGRRIRFPDRVGHRLLGLLITYGLASQRERFLTAASEAFSYLRRLLSVRKGCGAQRPHCVKGSDPRTLLLHGGSYCCGSVAATDSVSWSLLIWPAVGPTSLHWSPTVVFQLFGKELNTPCCPSATWYPPCCDQEPFATAVRIPELLRISRLHRAASLSMTAPLVTAIDRSVIDVGRFSSYCLPTGCLRQMRYLNSPGCRFRSLSQQTREQARVVTEFSVQLAVFYHFRFSLEVWPSCPNPLELADFPSAICRSDTRSFFTAQREQCDGIPTLPSQVRRVQFLAKF